MGPQVSEALYRYYQHSTAPAWVVFLLSVPLSFISPGLSTISWFAILPLSIVHGRLRKRRFVAAETRRFQREVAEEGLGTSDAHA